MWAVNHRVLLRNKKGTFSCSSLRQTRWLMKAEGFAMVGILGLIIA